MQIAEMAGQHYLQCVHIQETYMGWVLGSLAQNRLFQVYFHKLVQQLLLSSAYLPCPNQTPPINNYLFGAYFVYLAAQKDEMCSTTYSPPKKDLKLLGKVPDISC